MTAPTTTTTKATSELERLVGTVKDWHAGRTPRLAIVSEECWCHGAGGRDEAYLPDAGSIEGPQVYTEYCPCENGQSVKATEDRLRALIYGEQDRLKLARMWQGAGVPPHYEHFTLDTYPVSEATRAPLAAVRKWLDDGDRWLYLHGPYGTGKTGLAVSLMRLLVDGAAGRAPLPGLFIAVPDLLDRLRQSYSADRQAGDTSERELLRSLNDVPLLVLDDLGAERSTDWAVERLFSVINHRHDFHRRTIVTSNLGPVKLAEALGERSVWRIVEMCRVASENPPAYLVGLHGPNLRNPDR